MYEYVKSFISKDLLDSRDEKLMKELRDFADEELDSIRQEKNDAALKDLAPAYTGKYLLLCGGTPTKIGFTIPEKDDFVIVYVKKLHHAGEGFFTCDAAIMRIKYTSEKSPEESLNVFSKKFSKVSVATYNDPVLRINFTDSQRFITEEEVDRYVQSVQLDLANNYAWFMEQKQ
jgi:hypothetical protein